MAPGKNPPVGPSAGNRASSTAVNAPSAGESVPPGLASVATAPGWEELTLIGVLCNPTVPS